MSNSPPKPIFRLQRTDGEERNWLEGKVLDDVAERIRGPSIDDDFIMKVRRCGAPGATNVSDDLASPHTISYLRLDLAEVRVFRRLSKSVGDHN